MSARNDSVSNGLLRPKNCKGIHRKHNEYFQQKLVNDFENELRKLSIESNEIKLQMKKSQEKTDEKDVTRIFLEFFGSIPEYDDVNHLSNKDFYKKLENLKMKQKQYSDFLQTEIKLPNTTTECIDNYHSLEKNCKEKTTTPKDKLIFTTPILRSKKAKNSNKYGNLELLSLSDKEMKPSARSVRIERPTSLKNEKLSTNSSPVELSKTPNRSPSVSLRDWDKLSDEEFKLNINKTNSPRKQEKSLDFKHDEATIPKILSVRDEDNHIIDTCSTIGKTKKIKGKSHMFRANPIPIESRIPLFEHLMAEQEYKNRLNREIRKADLVSHMRPFSFTKRDEELQAISKKFSKSSPSIFHEEKNEKELKQFTAKPVPENLFSNYIYHKMYEDEFYRSLQKKIRAEEMLKAASLPPSMAEREKNKKILSVCPKSYKTALYKDDFPEFMRSKNIPDINKFYERHGKELEDLKNELISISPKPFKFKKSKSKFKLGFRPDTLSSSSSRTNSASGLRRISRSNLAAVLRIESARKRLQDKMNEKLEEAKLIEESRWKEKNMRKKPVWQVLTFSHEEDLAMRLRLRKDEERLRKEEHRIKMELMFDRVGQQPTLFERQSRVNFFN